LNKTEGDGEQFYDTKLSHNRSSIFAKNDIREDDRLGYMTRVQIKGLDRKGREVWSEENNDEVSIVAACIKLVNIPTMFDLGTSAVNPCDE